MKKLLFLLLLLFFLPEIVSAALRCPSTTCYLFGIFPYTCSECKRCAWYGCEYCENGPAEENAGGYIVSGQCCNGGQLVDVPETFCNASASIYFYTKTTYACINGLGLREKSVILPCPSGQVYSGDSSCKMPCIPQATTTTTTTPSTTTKPGCSSHADCSQACTTLCPANVYGCCYGCKLGQCINGKCECVDAVSYCSGNPSYQKGSKCIAGGTTTTPTQPTTTTTTTSSPTTTTLLPLTTTTLPPTTTTLPCRYSITITPTHLISQDVRANWKITLTDSSSSSCPSTTIFKIMPEISSGTVCKYLNYPQEIPIRRGGSNYFYLTIERGDLLPCSLRLYIQDPNGENIASAGTYTLSPIVEVTTTTTLPTRECNVAKDCCNENRYGTYYKCYNGICVVASIQDSDKYYCPIPGKTTSSTTTTTIKTTTTTIPPTTTPTQPTTSTTPPYTPCSSGYSCVPSSGISSFCYGCGQNRMSCDCKPQSTPCNQVGSNYCCKCISTPIPAGIFDSLWNFIKSLLGIK